MIIKGNLNVLEQHRQRNRPNRPPAVSHLTSAAMQQERLQDQPSSARQTDDSIVANDDDEVSCPDSDDQHSRAPRHSKDTPDPQTLKYYPASWKTVLERAKRGFERHVFLHCGFASRNKYLGVASTILHEEIARGKAEQLTLDNGRMCNFSISDP